MVIKATKGDKIFHFFNAVILILFMLTIAYPFTYLISVSISDPQLVLKGKVWLFPKKLNLASYKFIIHYAGFWKAYLNTIIYAVCGTLWGLTLTMTTAYPLSRKHLKGRSLYMGYLMVTMYFSGGMIPSYILYKNLHLLDTRWVMIVGGVTVYYVILAKTSFEAIPDSIFDSAKIDGSSYYGIFFKIVLPLSKAIIAVIVLFISVGIWNSYFTALIYLNRKELYPVQVILQRILISLQMSGVMESVQADNRVSMGQGIRYAMIIVTLLPIVSVYPFIQKYFIKGMLLGSVKG